jgi:hypothetical protein
MNKTVQTITSSLFLALVVPTANADTIDKQLLKRAAFAIGVLAEDLNIVSKETEGIRIDFAVKSKEGKKFDCYVSSVGVNMSDAICSTLGKGATMVGPDNALTQEYKRIQGR